MPMTLLRRFPIQLLSGLLLITALALPATLRAQQLDVAITDVDFSQLPRVTFKACVRENGQIVRGLDESMFMLLENGTPQNISIRCPDPTEINSVALVLDNSGSIFAALPKLVEASKRLVDSLGDNDEAAIVTFGRSIQIEQAFTTDKTRLKNVLDGMVASGGTAMFDAAIEACNQLEQRSGNRHAVIISDGEDNLSSATVDDVIELANLLDIKLHTIAFDIAPDVQDQMRRMAVETGGVYFFVSRPSELTTVYEKIADIITEPCCIGEYVSDNCEYTERSLLLTVNDGSRSGTNQVTLPCPWRSEQSTLTVDVPEELTPLATGRGYIDIAPVPSLELKLTLSFTLVYDENLVEIPLLPFTLATIAQNQLVDMKRISPGRLRFTLSEIEPALATSRLVGFPIQALVADSSKRVSFRIEDPEIVGCPTEFTMVPDSTLICQCFRALDVEMDSLRVYAANERISIPVRISGGLETGLPMLASIAVALPEGADDISVLPGTLVNAEDLEWEISGSRLDVATRGTVLPRDTSGVLVRIVLGPNTGKDVQQHRIALLASELWQRCCPTDGDLPVLRVLQDGNCSVILRRAAPQVEVENAPNPFSVTDGGRTTVILHVPEQLNGADVRLDIHDSRGTHVRTLYHGPLPEGEHHIPFDAGDLPAGTYYAVLVSGRTVVTRTMLYVR